MINLDQPFVWVHILSSSYVSVKITTYIFRNSFRCIQ